MAKREECNERGKPDPSAEIAERSKAHRGEFRDVPSSVQTQDVVVSIDRKIHLNFLL